MKSVMLNAIALTLLLPLAACDQAEHTDSQPASSATTAQVASDAGNKAPTSWVARRVADAMQEARQELATKNIDVDTIHIGNSLRSRGTRSKAQITPQGDLLIDGKKVTATPEQREMLLGYRHRVIGIAEAGMDIGTQGADLGIRAAKEAMWGAFTGKSDRDIEASIKPQTEKIKAAAATLCRQLPDLLSAQQKLAAAMPEFRPYATMQQKDVDDCGKDMQDMDGKQGFAVFSD
jgi:hypothetical protein